MQFRTQIPKDINPSGIVLVQTDQGHSTLKVKLPPGGKPGDTILFEVPEQHTATDKPIDAVLEGAKRSIFYRICCCCCLCCCPNGLVLSEWIVAFLIGLWIGLSIMLGFALGTLSMKQGNEPELWSMIYNKKSFTQMDRVLVILWKTGHSKGTSLVATTACRTYEAILCNQQFEFNS